VRFHCAASPPAEVEVEGKKIWKSLRTFKSSILIVDPVIIYMHIINLAHGTSQPLELISIYVEAGFRN
jgi:hypothetical protein